MAEKPIDYSKIDWRPLRLPKRSKSVVKVQPLKENAETYCRKKLGKFLQEINYPTNWQENIDIKVNKEPSLNISIDYPDT